MKSIVPLLVLSLLFAGCVSPIPGNWRNVQKDGSRVPRSQQVTMAFEPTGQITIAGRHGNRTPIGSYRLQDGVLFLESEGQTVRYRYEMTNRTLRLQNVSRRSSYLLFIREGGR